MQETAVKCHCCVKMDTNDILEIHQIKRRRVCCLRAVEQGAELRFHEGQQFAFT
jgi:hypothetical protein